MRAPWQSHLGEPCSDVEAVFARGTGEPPGVGGIGQAFVDALRAQVGGRSLDVYAVDYPASGDFGSGIDFAMTVIQGITDAVNHIQATAANCPNTRIVLGGFSRRGPGRLRHFRCYTRRYPGRDAPFLPKPMPPEIAGHVAAVALFGKPSDAWLQDSGAPTIVIGPLYVAKTIDLCAGGDTIYHGDPGGLPSFAHASYPVNGMVGQAAGFAVRQL